MTRSSIKHHLFALAGFFIITLGLFWPTIFGSVLVERDLIRLTYPYKWLAAHIWMGGAVPLWNTTGAMGTPLLADPITGAFDPFLPIFLLPVSVYTAGTLSIWLKYFLAGAAMYRYLFRTGISRTGKTASRHGAGHSGAFLGGAAFMLAGFSIGSWTLLQWVSALWLLPLALTVPHTGGSARGRGLAGAAVLCLSLWSGAIEPTLFILLFWIVETCHVAKRTFSEIATGVSAFIALSLFQILPAWELYLMSSRLGGLNISEALAYSVSPLQAIGIVAPINFLSPGGGPSLSGMFPFPYPLFFGTYVGAALLPLSILGVSKGRRRFAIIAIVGVLFSLGSFLPGLSTLLLKFPFLCILRYPVKFLFFLPPTLAILAAHGSSRLETCEPPQACLFDDPVHDHPVNAKTCSLAALASLLLIMGIFAAGIYSPDPHQDSLTAALTYLAQSSEIARAAQHSLIALLASAILMIIIAAGLPGNKKDAGSIPDRHMAGGTGATCPWARPLLIFVIICDLFPSARASLLFEPPATAATPAVRSAIPDRWPRILSTAANSFPEKNSSGTRQLHELMDVNSGVPYLVRYAEEYGSFRMKKYERWWESLDDPGNPGRSLRELGAAGIGYFVCDSSVVGRALDAGWVESKQDDRIDRVHQVDEHARVLELFLFENPLRMPELRFYPGVYSPRRQDLLQPGTPSVVSYRADLDGRVEAIVNVTQSGWLYRAESFFPGWRAFADGRRIQVVAAPGIGQMVFLAKQETKPDIPALTKVVFDYAPPLFFIGLTASACAGVLCSLVLGYSLFQRSTNSDG